MKFQWNHQKGIASKSSHMFVHATSAYMALQQDKMFPLNCITIFSVLHSSLLSCIHLSLRYFLLFLLFLRMQYLQKIIQKDLGFDYNLANPILTDVHADVWVMHKGLSTYSYPKRMETQLLCFTIHKYINTPRGVQLYVTLSIETQ